MVISIRHFCSLNLETDRHFVFTADFAFIHSKFIAPLPPSVDEFMSSLRLAFPQVLDINHLLKDVGPVRKLTNTSATLSYLKNRFFAPIDVEIPYKGQSLSLMHTRIMIYTM